MPVMASCPWYARHMCDKGLTCPNGSHRGVACKEYSRNGNCRRGDECLLKQVPPNVPLRAPTGVILCPYFSKNKCRKAAGCRRSHMRIQCPYFRKTEFCRLRSDCPHFHIVKPRLAHDAEAAITSSTKDMDDLSAVPPRDQPRDLPSIASAIVKLTTTSGSTATTAPSPPSEAEKEDRS